MLKLMQRGDPVAASLPMTEMVAAWPRRDSARDLNATCDECGSTYFASGSRAGVLLCPECSHHLHGTPRCDHQMIAGRCETCGWDGTVSDYILHITGRGKTFRQPPR